MMSPAGSLLIGWLVLSLLNVSLSSVNLALRLNFE